MCGVVGLHLRDAALAPRLGAMLAAMTGQLCERGPDSAGFAVYGDPSLTPAGTATVSVLAGPAPDAGAIAATVSGALSGLQVSVDRGGQSLLVHAAVPVDRLAGAVRGALPGVVLSGEGNDLAVLKGVGDPRALAAQIDLPAVSGYQGLAHTRMATESAVTAAHCHPFSVGPDLAFVHNGSFANHATIRRQLQADGVVFDSDNDSEVGARFPGRSPGRRRGSRQGAAGAHRDLRRLLHPGRGDRRRAGRRAGPGGVQAVPGRRGAPAGSRWPRSTGRSRSCPTSPARVSASPSRNRCSRGRGDRPGVAGRRAGGRGHRAGPGDDERPRRQRRAPLAARGGAGPAAGARGPAQPRGGARRRGPRWASTGRSATTSPDCPSRRRCESADRWVRARGRTSCPARWSWTATPARAWPRPPAVAPSSCTARRP